MWQKLVMVMAIAMLLLGRAPSLLAMEVGKVPPLLTQQHQFSHCLNHHAVTEQRRATGHTSLTSCHGSSHCTCQPMAMVASEIARAKFLFSHMTAPSAVPLLPTITPQPPERPPRAT